MIPSSADRTIHDDARAAVALMETHRLDPTPETYEVMLNHVLGADKRLSAEIAGLIAKGALTDLAVQSLHKEHFAEHDLTVQVMATGERIGRELKDVMQNLAEVEERTAAYGETLEDASTALKDEEDPGRVRDVVDDLLLATRAMEERSRDLERQLTQSSSEVETLRAALAQVRQESLTDALTGVSNRKAFDIELSRLVALSAAGGPSFTLVLADIDHFKRVNDVWGHQTGDQVIRFVASVLQRIAGPGRMVARYGGEEFAVLMPEVTAARAAVLCEEGRRLVEGKKLVRRSTNEDLGQITISMGVASLAPGEPERALVERADVALYESKRNGRNQVTIRNPHGAAKAA